MNDIEKILTEYRSLNLENIIDFTKFNEYAVTHHSTVIEGSTLTENETRLLLDEGITPKGKPLEHSLMVKNHFTVALQRNSNFLNSTLWKWLSFSLESI